MKWLRPLVVFLLITVFLVRVFDFAHIQFDSDFGRDSLFGYRILHDKPTLLGAQASVGGFYLGPLYFYTIAALFALFGPTPEIIMLFFALLNVLAAWIGWRVLTKEVSKSAGLIFLSLFAFSLPLILASRGATHMPMLPVITLLVVALLTRAVRSGKFMDHLFSGLALGLYLHVHFSALLLFPGYFLAVVLLTRGGWRKKIENVAAAGLALLIMASPLILFDVRHGFITSKAFFQYLTSSAAGGAIRAAFPHWTFSQRIDGLLVYFGSSLLPKFVAVIGMLAALTLTLRHKVRANLLVSSVGFLVVSAVGLLLLYKGYLFSYYLIVPGVLVLFCVAILLSKLRWIGVLLAAALALGNLAGLGVVYTPNWRTVTNVSRIVSVIEQHQDESGRQPFEVFKDSADGMTGLAYEYRFLLERDGYTPVSEYEYQKAQVLYVVREDGENDPLSLGNYEVAQFHPAKIQWKDVVNLSGKQVYIFALTK